MYEGHAEAWSVALLRSRGKVVEVGEALSRVSVGAQHRGLFQRSSDAHLAVQCLIKLGQSGVGMPLQQGEMTHQVMDVLLASRVAGQVRVGQRGL